MRFFEFKNVNLHQNLAEQSDDNDEEKLPVGRMNTKNLTTQDRKYVKTIASSIAQDRTFTFDVKKNASVPSEYKGQVVKGQIVNGKELIGQLEISKDPANAIAEVDVEDGGVIKVPMKMMVKDAAATGEIRFNLGNVAEAVMGSAVTAAFAKGGKNTTRQDVIDIGKVVASTGEYNSTTPSRDKISFAVTIPVADTNVFSAFVSEGEQGLKDLDIDSKKIKVISKMFDDAVQYVNESQNVEAAIKKAAADPAENRVSVLSDGGNAEKQNTTKVDLEVFYDGQKINLISLKTGAIKQFGQQSGAGFSNIERFFKSTVGFGLPSSMEPNFTAASEKDKTEVFNKGLKPAYQHIFKELKSQVAGDNERKEYDLVKTIYEGIRYHATRDEEGVILVILSPTAKKAYQELQFGEPLLEALRGYNLDVELEVGRNLSIVVTGTAKTKEAASVDKFDKLVKFRSYLQSGGIVIRNVVEMEGLLKDLADLQKLQAKIDKEPKPKATVEPQATNKPKQVEPQDNRDNDERSF